MRTSTLVTATALALGAVVPATHAGAAPTIGSTAADHRRAPGLPGGLSPERSTVLDFQRAMNSGRLTSVQLAGFYEHRIAQLNPALHAVIAVNPDALAE